MVGLSLTYLILLKLLFVSSHVHFRKVPAIIVFGDSTVDAGNNNHIVTLLKGNFRPYGRDFEGGKPTGRFCNGRLVTDFLAEEFGIKPYIPAYLDPNYGIEDFATGVAFASAGTGYDNLTSDTVSVIGLWKELEYFKDYQKRLAKFKGKNNAMTVVREALYVISLGTNDFIENYFVRPERSSQFTLEEYQNYLIGIAESFVYELYQLGARKISLGGLPPIGCVPLLRSSNIGKACLDEFNNLAREFDGKLVALIGKLRRELEGIKLVFTDVLEPSLQIIDNPSSYGFNSVARGCCGTGSIEMGYLCHESSPFTCTDATKYVFWDAVHPTEKFYQLIARNMMKTSLVEFL